MSPSDFRPRPSLLVPLALLLLGLAGAAAPDWGFFGHRRINRLAVFTLDPDMMPFFRAHVEWLTDHAVDPDKRRYATKHEAVRHYIDIDHWGRAPFHHVPRDFATALINRSTIHLAVGGDTLHWTVDTILRAGPGAPFVDSDRVLLTWGAQTVEVPLGRLRRFWYRNVRPVYYEDIRTVAVDSLSFLPGSRGGGAAGAGPGGATAWVTETFSEYGILPYHLLAYHRRLTQAFRSRDADFILRTAAEMGHYVGDAHVPLHTTENYNGQLTGQTGIHGFWESRLPELFADAEYDYLVGKATYIEDPANYYWNIVLRSHALVDSVLHSERRLRASYPADQQQCYDERLGREILTPCPEFSRAWSEEMRGMVEDRFRASIRSVGSVWYSCWVDAGQPRLDELVPGAALAEPDTLLGRHGFPSRSHEGGR